VRFTNGVAATMVEDIRQLTNGLTPTDNITSVYSTKNYTSGTFVRNTNLWCRKYVDDLTAVSPWNSMSGRFRAGTLITPRHFVVAKHFTPLYPAGTTLRFIGTNNVVYDRTVIKVGSYIDHGIFYSDCSIGVLNEDLPAEIKPMKILPDNQTLISYFPSQVWTLPIPLLVVDQFENVQLLGAYAPAHAAWWHSLSPWGTTLIPGDSGSPVMFPIGDSLVLFSEATAPNGGPHIAYQINSINNLIAELDEEAGYQTGYTCSVIDLSSFPSY